MPDVSTCIAGIEDLREKREEVQKQIRDEEAEKGKLQQDLQLLTKRLAHINDALARKVRNGMQSDARHIPFSWHQLPHLSILAELQTF